MACFWVFYKKIEWIIFLIWSLMLFSQSVRELMGDWKERSVNRPRREWIPSDKSLELGSITLWKDVVYDSVINSQNRPNQIILVLDSQYGPQLII